MAHHPVVIGVYFLFKAGALVYVGQSKDCYGRIAKHRANGREFDVATVMMVQADVLGTVEKALIAGFRPAQNVVHVVKEKPPKAPKPIRAIRVVVPDSIIERPERVRPGPDALGLVSRGRARQLATSYGIPGAAIDEGEKDGSLCFLPTGDAPNRGTHRARFADVEAFYITRRDVHLASLGFASLPATHTGGL